MSIINDALKKLQTQISQTQNVSTQEEPSSSLTATQQAGFEPPNPTPPPTPGSPQKKTEKNDGSRLVLILGLLCLLTALFAPIVNKQSVISMIWNKIQQRSQATSNQNFQTPSQPQSNPSEMASSPITPTFTPKSTKQQPPKPQEIKHTPTPTISKPQNIQPSRLIINGIMTQGEKNVALIDGQVYEEGDEVDGIKILKITPKGITVLENGSERIVKVMGQ